MSFIEEKHTDVDFSLKKHLITAENISDKRELDDFDNRKTANGLDRDWDQKLTIKVHSHIKSEEDSLETHTEINFSVKKRRLTAESITVKEELGDFDNRPTANEVYQDLDQKSTIKSEEDENFINIQNLIEHEEVDIKSEDDVEQSHTQVSAIEKKGCHQSNNRVEGHSSQSNSADELYMCNDCSYETPYKLLLKKHVLLHRYPDRVKNDQITIHKCPDCPFQSINKMYVKKHSIRHRKPDETVWHRCTECPYKSNRKGDLKKHSIQHRKPEEIVWHRCTECPYKTAWKQHLKRHLLVQHGQKHVLTHRNDDQLEWFKCEQCSFKTNLKSSLYRHTLIHNKDHATGLLQCTFCSFKTLRKYDFKLHQSRARHQDDESLGWHKCPECPYKATQKSHMLKHAKNHKAADQTDWFQCPECSYKTPRTCNLKWHQTLHLGEDIPRKECPEHDRPHKTYVKTKLKLGDKFLKCPQCPYKTTRNAKLKQHVQRHASPDQLKRFKCEQCSFKTNLKSTLNRHILIHNMDHAEGLLQCTSCSFKTLRKYDLKVHQSRSRHQDDNSPG